MPNSVFAIQAKVRRDGYLLNSLPPLTNGQKGRITGLLNLACGDNATRYIVLAWLFTYSEPPLTPLSSKLLTNGQWQALNHWVDWIENDASDAWYSNIASVILAAKAAASADEQEYLGARQTPIVQASIALGGTLCQDQN